MGHGASCRTAARELRGCGTGQALPAPRSPAPQQTQSDAGFLSLSPEVESRALGAEQDRGAGRCSYPRRGEHAARWGTCGPGFWSPRTMDVGRRARKGEGRREAGWSCGCRRGEESAFAQRLPPPPRPGHREVTARAAQWGRLSASGSCLRTRDVVLGLSGSEPFPAPLRHTTGKFQRLEKAEQKLAGGLYLKSPGRQDSHGAVGVGLTLGQPAGTAASRPGQQGRDSISRPRLLRSALQALSTAHSKQSEKRPKRPLTAPSSPTRGYRPSPELPFPTRPIIHQTPQRRWGAGPGPKHQP